MRATAKPGPIQNGLARRSHRTNDIGALHRILRRLTNLNTRRQFSACSSAKSSAFSIDRPHTRTEASVRTCEIVRDGSLPARRTRIAKCDASLRASARVATALAAAVRMAVISAASITAAGSLFRINSGTSPGGDGSPSFAIVGIDRIIFAPRPEDHQGTPASSREVTPPKLHYVRNGCSGNHGHIGPQQPVRLQHVRWHARTRRIWQSWLRASRQ